MANKKSDEARIQEYFETANIAKAEVMLELAKATVKRRQNQEKSTTVRRKTKETIARSGDFKLQVPTLSDQEYYINSQ